MINLFLTIVFLAVSLVFSKNALHMFQQNRYEFKRYTDWLFSVKNLHFSKTVIYVLLMIVLSFFNDSLSFILGTIISVCFAALMIKEETKKEYIKPLVYTGRVKRQIVVFAILQTVALWLCIFGNKSTTVGVVAVYLPYLMIYVVGIITLPIENCIKKGYENDARKILASYDDLIKVGITGSYGKTTTKNVVKDIIGEKFYTLITPASYNTPMGITRTIRENFKPIYEVFVCEMGADHVGEISYLMDFVKPKYGIVTSIGPQHLNTFGSLENIINEKMQEIEMLPLDGVGIINIDNEYINNYKIRNRCKVVTVGIKNKKADYIAKDIKYTKDGSSFTVKIDGKDIKFKTELLGEHNIMNVLCGIALAKELGITNKELIKGVANVKQVEHRLQVKIINGHTFIDNAFNSNPVGCKYSLDVLSMMKGKRVIVTPGLIDLGKEEDKANYEFGKYMKDRTDFVILVGEKSSSAIFKGLQESGYDMKKVLVVSSVKEAFAYVYCNFDKNAKILLENDLPDAFLY